MVESMITYYNPVDFSDDNVHLVLEWFQAERKKSKKVSLSTMFFIPHCAYQGQIVSIKIHCNSVGGFNLKKIEIASNNTPLVDGEKEVLEKSIRTYFSEKSKSELENKSSDGVTVTHENEDDYAYAQRVTEAIQPGAARRRAANAVKSVGKKVLVGVAVAGLFVAAAHVIGLHLLGVHLFRAAHAISEVAVGLGAIGFGAWAASKFEQRKLNRHDSVAQLKEKQAEKIPVKDTDGASDNGSPRSSPFLTRSRSSNFSDDSQSSMNTSHSTDSLGDLSEDEVFGPSTLRNT